MLALKAFIAAILLSVAMVQSMRITQDSFDASGIRRNGVNKALGKASMGDTTKSLLNEINTHQHGLRTLGKHRSFMKDILAKSKEKSTQPENVATIMGKDHQLRYISSEADDDEPNNKNINDKIWKLALKYGASVVQPGVENRFYVTFAFMDFMVLRYLYESIPSGTSAQAKASDNAPNVKLLEFQWHLFGKMVYSRNIDRPEHWHLLHQDDGFVLWDVKNMVNVDGFNDESTTQYDRRIAFQKEAT
jgi:hypothetical protein